MANINESKKYHFIYKTTNLLNDKYYVGMHSTSNLKDGYLGSGTRLRRAVRKYGKENFRLEILQFFNSREELVEREKELVNENLVKDPSCLNLKPGGDGGLCSEEHRLKFNRAGLEKIKFLKETSEEYREKRSSTMSDNNRKLWSSGIFKHKPPSFKGKVHLEKTKMKIAAANRLKQRGEKNSQHGTKWISNGEFNKKIKAADTIPDGWKLGRVMKKK